MHNFIYRRAGVVASKLLACLLLIYGLHAWKGKSVEAQSQPSLRYDQIQQKFVHNAFGAIPDPVDEAIGEQLIHYGIRGLELDLHPRQPDYRPNHERDWFIYHVPGGFVGAPDYEASTVRRLTEALRILRGFHNAHPQHEVVTINFEWGSGKGDKGNTSEFSDGRTPEMLDGLLREYLGNALYTPQDLLNDHPGAKTLHEAVTPVENNPLRSGWRKTDQLRGKFIFIVHGDGLTGYDINLYFPGTKEGFQGQPYSQENLNKIHSRVCFLIDDEAWKNYVPGDLPNRLPHSVFHSEFAYKDDAPSAKAIRHDLPGHVLRSAQHDDCNKKVCTGGTNRTRFTESQQAGINLLYMNMGSIHDPAFRTANDQGYPFGASVLEADGNYSYTRPGYGVWMHAAIANKVEPGSQLILGDRLGGDINGGADSFNFFRAPAVPPNGQREQWTAAIASASNTSIHSYAKGLLMARETTSPNSRFFAVGRAGDNHGLIVMYRKRDGEDAVYKEPALPYKENFNHVLLELVPTQENGLNGYRCRGLGSQTGNQGTWFLIWSEFIEGNLGYKGMAVSSNGGWDNGRTPAIQFNAPYSDYKTFDFVGLRTQFGNDPWQYANLNNFQFEGIGNDRPRNDPAAVQKRYYPCGEDCTTSSETTITRVTPSPSKLGDTVTVYYTVRTVVPGAPAPTGSVTVYGGEVSCMGSLTGTIQTASGSCTVRYTEGGPRGIVANYAGDNNYKPSGSIEAEHYITRNLTTTTLTSSANPVMSGEPMTFTATVTGASPQGHQLTGFVLFVMDLTSYEVPLVNGVAQFHLPRYSPGIFTMEARYQGDAYFEPSQASVNQEVTCPNITIGPAALSQGTVLAPYSQTLTATGLLPNDRGFFVEGINYLPPGLKLDFVSGVISGTPQAVGTYAFPIGASDLGSNCRGMRDYTMTIACPAITLAALPDAPLGSAYNQALNAAPAGGEYVYAITAGALPPGLSFNPASGAVSGTPTQAGTYNFTARAIGFKGVNGPPDDQGNFTFVNGACNGSRTYALRVTSACPITINPATLLIGTLGASYNQTLTAGGGTAPYGFTLSTGALPPGLTLGLNGALSGAPTASGSFSFTVKATDAKGCAGTQNYNLPVTSNTCTTLTLNPTMLPAATTGKAYNQPVSATGGAGPYSFVITQGTLPPGLTLSSDGLISGTPVQGGTFSFTIRATAANGCTGSRTYLLTLACATLSFTPATLPNATASVSYNQTLTVAPAAHYSFSLLVGQLPPGFTLSSAGIISGMTTQTGTYNFTVKALTGSCQGTKAYTLTIANAVPARSAALAMSGDYDGDGQADAVLWSAATGEWQIIKNGLRQALTLNWGTAGDLTLFGDYDGDGKSDLAVFRPAEATFYIKRSGDGSALVKQWGLATDVPVPGDYDGDGKTDIAVWRGSNGTWYIVRSSDGMIDVVAWGAAYAPYHDVPVPGDYDGDGKTDLAVFRRANGNWLIKPSTGRSSVGQFIVKQWGLGTDVPVAGDYDGDGQTDIAVWRASEGNWYILRSATGLAQISTWGSGQLNDQTMPADYDGDGLADLAVWRPAESTWHIKPSGNGAALTRTQGQSSDLPVQATRR